MLYKTCKVNFVIILFFWWYVTLIIYKFQIRNNRGVCGPIQHLFICTKKYMFSLKPVRLPAHSATSTTISWPNDEALVWDFWCIMQGGEVCNREHNWGENSQSSREEETSVWGVSSFFHSTYTAITVDIWFDQVLLAYRTVGGSNDALGKLTEADMRFLFAT